MRDRYFQRPARKRLGRRSSVVQHPDCEIMVRITVYAQSEDRRSATCRLMRGGTVVLLLVVIAHGPATGSRPTSAAAPQGGNHVAAKSNGDTTPQKIQRYVRRLFTKYDVNLSGVLEATEWRAMQGTPGRADADRDGILTRGEFIRHVLSYGRSRRITGSAGDLARTTPDFASPPTDSSGESAKRNTKGAAAEPSPDDDYRRDRKFYIPRRRLPKGLPSWFLDRDADGDGQLTLAEYASAGQQSGSTDFSRMDVNRDGLLTAAECAGPLQSDLKPSKKSEPKLPDAKDAETP